LENTVTVIAKLISGKTQYEQFSRNLCCESYNLYLCPKYVAELGYKQNLTIQV